MDLSKLTKLKGLKRKKGRIGRGMGTGTGGHTVGRGMKGQKSRSGGRVKPGFEGGQNPLYKRLPQIGGFKNHSAKKIVSFSISKLNFFKEGSKVSPKDFVKRGLLKKLPKHGVKLLGGGNLTKKIKVEGFLMSISAKEKVEKAGGSVVS